VRVCEREASVFSPTSSALQVVYSYSPCNRSITRLRLRLDLSQGVRENTINSFQT
jgi:hypothetical protein